jgi:hypothetical protein
MSFYPVTPCDVTRNSAEGVALGLLGHAVMVAVARTWPRRARRIVRVDGEPKTWDMNRHVSERWPVVNDPVRAASSHRVAEQDRASLHAPQEHWPSRPAARPCSRGRSYAPSWSVSGVPSRRPPEP